MPRRKLPLMLRLLRHAAGEHSVPGRNPPLELHRSDDSTIESMVCAGLGPLLYRAAGSRVSELPARCHAMLRGAELTARVRYAGARAALLDVAVLCEAMRLPLTLLKGISISQQYYPAAHLRPMSDIDLLVPADAWRALEKALLERGYVAYPDFGLDEHSYHGAPLNRSAHGAWIEIHWGLFPRDHALQRNGAFDPLRLARSCVPCDLHGPHVMRLSDETQLLYTAAFWLRDLCSQHIHLSHAPPLFDATFLLTAAHGRIRWDMVLAGLRNDHLTASLYFLLVYLARHDLYPADPAILRFLQRRQALLGPLELRMMHALLDKHLLQDAASLRLCESWHVFANLLAPDNRALKLMALPWNIAFPPREPDRYGLRYHLQRCKRVTARLRTQLSGRAVQRRE
jgi:hypothetical protein